ncbi:MAG: hypothetical protein HY807_04470 [Nitrospirae bacterium]|nr:hypothetical protein [Nitrospirota bacterium]
MITTKRHLSRNRHKAWCVLLFLVLFFSFSFVSLSEAATLDKEIAEAYISADYKKTVKLLEEQINQLKDKGTDSKARRSSELYQKELLLAHIYAWKLNKYDVALAKYQKLDELRQPHNGSDEFPSIELLYIAEIYEKTGKPEKAQESYQNLLKELNYSLEKEHDDVSIIMNEELTRFISYQIDGMNLSKKIKPLLPKLKLSSFLTSSAISPFLTIVLVPTAQYDLTIAVKTDMAEYIKQSPANLNSMFLNYGLIVTASAGTVDESSEQAMEAYTLKYPESYYSLLLRYMFYKFYKESGQDAKAVKLLSELKKIAQKRGIEIITEPDKRFSSPEKTWAIYKKAFREGDVDTLAECYVPGVGITMKAFKEVGKDKMREIGETMGDIEKITGNEESAKYRIKRKETYQNKEYDIGYSINFQNIDGEWKMYDF